MNKKPIFIMLVGLPASGKSTYAEKISIKKNIHLSSDNIRLEYGFEAGQGNDKVFEEMKKRTIINLNEGKNVIYDATNLVRKNRKYILESIKKIDCKKVCIIFAEPYRVCLERNNKREGFSFVPTEIMKRMLLSFQIPMINEGFDKIEIIQTEKGKDIEEYLEDSKIFLQDNSHHNLSLFDHMVTAAKYINMNYTGDKKDILETAALFHDIGKLVTKNFLDSKGNPSKEAHYYGHENAGAYMFLSANSSYFSKSERLIIATLINWHMRPYVQMKESKRLLEYKLLGTELYEMLTILNKADINSRG